MACVRGEAMLRMMRVVVVLVTVLAGCGEREAKRSVSADPTDLDGKTVAVDPRVSPSLPSELGSGEVDAAAADGKSSTMTKMGDPAPDPAPDTGGTLTTESSLPSAEATRLSPEQAARLLADMASDAALERQAAVERLDALGPEAIAWVLRALRDGPPSEQRGAAMYMIGRVGPRDDDVAKALVGLLESSDEAIRRTAFQAVERMGDAQLVPALPALIAMAEDVNEDPRYRGRAVRAIAKLREAGREATDNLFALARDDTDLNVRRAAFFAITRVTPYAEAERFFAERLSEDPHEDLRRLAAKWLGQVAVTESALDALIHAFRDPDPLVRDEAVGALVEIGRPAVKTLVEALNDENVEVRRHAALTLGKMGPLAIEAMSALIERLEDPDERTRELAAAAVRLIRGG
jgi:HEAT repeat protein